MQSEKLKPCPFCGSSDVHLRQHPTAEMSWISCVGCGLEAPSETGVSDGDAVAYWNRRAESALSTDAEPVAWRWRSTLFTEWNLSDTPPIDQRSMEQLIELNMEGLEWQALFAEPLKTAPAVAVKDLEPEDPAVYRHWEKDELIAALIAERTLSAQVQDVAGWQNEEKLTPEQAWTILCETPDITSPEEYPDHALITFEQLQSYMERAHNSVEWKDISTAPRDGTKILMRGGAYHGLPFAGYWDRSPYAPDRPWVSAVNNSRLYEHVPTQWMPLPASPASKHGDAE